jgi:protein-S-isoprenylcysteine O-methyltransferase Ste14
MCDALANSAAANGGTMVYSEIYYDPGEWYESKWLVKGTAHGSPVPWAAIVIAALVVIGIGIIAYIIHDVKNTTWFGPVAIAGGIGLAALGIAILVRTIKQGGET